MMTMMIKRDKLWPHNDESNEEVLAKSNAEHNAKHNANHNAMHSTLMNPMKKCPQSALSALSAPTRLMMIVIL